MRISFRNAFSGWKVVFFHEQNFRIHVIAGLCVFCAGSALQLSSVELALLLLTIGFVLAMELVNSALERFLDILKPRISPYVGIINDIVAGAVLVSALTAVSIGCLLFIPKIMNLLKSV